MQVRNEIGVTQSQLADMLFVSLRTVQNYESGEYDDKDSPVIEKVMLKLAELKPTTVRDVPQAPYGIASKAKFIPFYDVDVSAGGVDMFSDKPEIPTLQLSVPGFEDCDFAVPVFGHSMYPTYENGVVVLCKKIKDYEIIPYGECYLILTEEQRMVKRLVKSKYKGFVLATSDNVKFDPFEVPKNKIRELYLIKGCIKRNQL